MRMKNGDKVIVSGKPSLVVGVDPEDGTLVIDLDNQHRHHGRSARRGPAY